MGFDFLKSISGAVKGMMSPSVEQTKKTEPVPPKPQQGAPGGGGWLMGALEKGLNFLGGKVADKFMPGGPPNIGSDDAEEPGTIGVTKGPGGEDSFIKTAAGAAKTETTPIPPEAVKQNAEKTVAAPAEAAQTDKAKSEAAPVEAAKEDKAKADAAPAEAAKEDKAKAEADPAAAAKADKAKAEANPVEVAAADKAKAEAAPADAEAAKKAKEAAAPAEVAATEKAKSDAAPTDALKEQKAKVNAPPTDAATPIKAKSDGPADKITPETASVAAKNPEVVAAAEKQPEALDVAKEKPEAGPVMAAVPAVAPVLKETPALAPIVAAAPELASSIAKDPGAPENKAIVEAVKDVPAASVDKDTKVTDETAKPKMSPTEAFALARAVEKGDATAKAEATKKIEENFSDFREAQDKAREAPTQEGRDKQDERAEFERKLALSPEVKEAIKDPLDQMCNKALDYLKKTRGEEYLTKEGKGGMGADLGEDPKKGWVGAIGTDPATVMEVMKSGNVRERALALQKFQEMMAADALRPAEIDKDTGKVIRPSGQDELKALFGAKKEDGQEDPNAFNADDFARLDKRVTDFKEDPTFKDKSAKNFLNPKWTDDETFREGKKEEMDSPLPAVSAEVARAQMAKEGDRHAGGALKPGEDPTTGKLTGAGGGSAVAHKQMTIEEAQAKGLDLSPREIAAAKKTGGMVSWNEGTDANIVDPNSPFIKGATEGAMPLKAGISGNAYRFGRLGETMGMDPAMMRLAMVSQLVPIEAHSFHEISMASQDFQNDEQKYDPSKPYTQSSIGLPQDKLDQFAGREGYDLEKLSQNPPKPGETT